MIVLILSADNAKLRSYLALPASTINLPYTPTATAVAKSITLPIIHDKLPHWLIQYHAYFLSVHTFDEIHPLYTDKTD